MRLILLIKSLVMWLISSLSFQLSTVEVLFKKKYSKLNGGINYSETNMVRNRKHEGGLIFFIVYSQKHSVIVLLYY